MLERNKVKMSIQQSFEIMLKSENNCSLDEYRTYAHLTRLGYKVIRHQGDLGITPYEKRIKLDQYRITKKRPMSTTSTKNSNKMAKIEDVVTIDDDDDDDIIIVDNGDNKNKNLLVFILLCLKLSHIQT